MAEVIEIFDSDDDEEQSGLVVYDDGLTVTPSRKNPDADDQTWMAVKDEAANATTFAHGMPAADSSIKSTSKQQTSQIQPTTVAHRKNIRQPICFNPDVELETIILSDDETGESTATTAASAVLKAGRVTRELPRLKATTNSLSGKQPATKHDMVDNACTELLNSANTERIIREIAEQRVWVNYLIASYNMPEIQFILGFEPSVLEFQLDERIRQRPMRNVEVRRRRNQGDAGASVTDEDN